MEKAKYMEEAKYMDEKGLLEIENLRLSFYGPEGRVEAVRGVSISLGAGECLALVGESGCGKTAMCRAIMGLHSQHAVMEEGSINLCGWDVGSLTEKEMESIRGREVAMVFQDPMTSLNPTYSIGSQIAEAIMAHKKISKKEACRQATDLLAQVGIPEPDRRFHSYPHHFSGGMRQRVAIAIALAADPKLLIADEPTTALDRDTQKKVMDLLSQIKEEEGRKRAILFVTHDLSLAEMVADRVAVMKEGRIVEMGPTQTLFQNPRHEYTKKLMGFAAYGKGTSHYHGMIHENPSQSRRTAQCDGKPLVEVKGLSKGFQLSGPRRPEVLRGRRQNRLQPQALEASRQGQYRPVLENFYLNIYKGEIVGLVGPSGCGKSTLARCLVDIYKPEKGEILYEQDCRKQMIFQDSASAFNPRMRLWEIIAEPLVIAARRGNTSVLPEELRKTCRGRRLDKEILLRKVYEVMDQVKLERELADRHPYNVSGGQRQRAAIARALITDPDFLIADEPISSLDVSIQSQIVHLLKQLHDERQLTMLLISHDLPMVEHISDRIVEMK